MECALRQGATHSHWSPIKRYAAKARRREGREVGCKLRKQQLEISLYRLAVYAHAHQGGAV